jgi:hypothetical protein
MYEAMPWFKYFALLDYTKVTILFDSLRRAFNAYTKKPFPFAWGSLLYVFLFIAFLFAVIGLALIYFMSMSVLNQEVNPQSIPTLAVFGLMAIIFMIMTNGLNAALAKTYRNALLKEKMSLTGFFSYSLDKAVPTFAMMLLRDLIWLIFAGPAIAIFVLYFMNMDYMDILFGSYLLFVTFFIHLAFTPSLLYVGLGTDFLSSFKRAFNLFKRRHINFIGLYGLFAIAWLLNFIPLIGLISIFFLYPIAYSAMISMVEGGVRIERDEEEN